MHMSEKSLCLRSEPLDDSEPKGCLIPVLILAIVGDGGLYHCLGQQHLSGIEVLAPSLYKGNWQKLDTQVQLMAS